MFVKYYLLCERAGLFHQVEEELLNQCPELELVAAYLDGNATADESRFMEGHIAECRGCRRLIKYIIKSEADVPNVTSPGPPDPEFNS
jgi:anti-sigma factor RsiW